MPATIVLLGVVGVALGVNDAKDNSQDARSDDELSEIPLGRRKHLPPVGFQVVGNVYLCHVVTNALLAQPALPLTGGLAAHA